MLEWLQVVTTKRSTLPLFRKCVFTLSYSRQTCNHYSLPFYTFSQTIALNITVLTELMTLYLPILKKQNEALREEKKASKYGLTGIINVSSMSAFMPIPSMALYAATKVGAKMGSVPLVVGPSQLNISILSILIVLCTLPFRVCIPGAAQRWL